MNDELQAKIFVSCGQIEKSYEEEISKKIENNLRKLGFDPYLAIGKISPKSIREVIFNEITTSEYFLFIDLKREKMITGPLGKSTEKRYKHRGSLLCHQELAISAYFNIPFIAFQQNGIKKRDGLSKYLQYKPIPFDDPNTLPKLITQEITEKIDSGEWSTKWKNQLCLKRNNTEFEDADDKETKKPYRFFHLEVHNHNPYKQAINCYGFLEEYTSLSTHKTVKPRTIELKWGGYVLPNATILPSSYRHIVAFYISKDKPNMIIFNCFTDSTYYQLYLKEPGEYNLTYRIISDNFKPVTKTFYMKFEDSLKDIAFREIEK